MTTPKPKGCPFAPPISGGLWPVLTTHPKRLEVNYTDTDGKHHGTKWGRAFGAPRANGRRHAGVDLFANDGDLVRAICDGIVLRNRGYFIRGTRPDGTTYAVRAILVDHGPIWVRYCEVWPLDMPGAREVRARITGQKAVQPDERLSVYADEAFARVTRMKSSQMVHLETWAAGSKPQPWRGKDPPKGLLDPTAMLLALAEDAK